VKLCLIEAPEGLVLCRDQSGERIF